jgi:apolipoprotein N-acyltransferase
MPLSARPAALLALLSGFLYFLAFPGLNLWPFAFVAFTPLIVALRGQTPKRAAWLGWLAGFTMTMIGFYWLLEMLETFSGFGTPVCLFFTAILCAYQSGRIALLGWIYARMERHGYSAVLAFVVGFAASEQAFPLLFPWSFAATVHQLPALNQLAEIGGPILVALPIVLASFGFAELVLARLDKRAIDRKKVGLLLAAPLLSALYGAVRIPMVDARTAAAEKGRVGLVQANMSLTGKRKNKQEGLRRHLTLTEELKRQGKLDLVVWSETSVMAALEEDEIATEVPRRFASALGVPTLFGAVVIQRVPDARRYQLYNSALLTDSAGQVKGRFDKQRLVLFSEGMPFGETFPILYDWSPNSGKFVPGTLYDPLPVGDHQIATVICYEDIIPGFVNRIVRNGDPDLLANLTNDAWFGDTTEPWIHLALSQLRAVEHRRFFVRSTNSGVSAIIDPVGRVVSHTGTFEEAALLGEVAWLRGLTGYELLGDAPWWIVSALALVMSFMRRPGATVPATPAAAPIVSARPAGKRKRARSDAKTERAAVKPAGPSGAAGTGNVAFGHKARGWFARQP